MPVSRDPGERLPPIPFRKSTAPDPRPPKPKLSPLEQIWASKGGKAPGGKRKKKRNKRSEWCRICGRKLTDPKSIEAGIGPECIKGHRPRRADF